MSNFTFEPEEEAAIAHEKWTREKDEIGPVVSWAAYDAYKELPESQKQEWKEAYLDKLKELGVSDAPFQTATFLI